MPMQLDVDCSQPLPEPLEGDPDPSNIESEGGLAASNINGHGSALTVGEDEGEC